MKEPGVTRRSFLQSAVAALFGASCTDVDPSAEGNCAEGEMAAYDVIAYDAAGNRLNEGDVVTSNVGSVYVQNGIVRYYPCNATGPEGHLDRWTGSAYTRALDAARGDGAFFVTPNANPPNRIILTKVSTAEIWGAAEWDAWNFNTGYLGTPGVTYRDWSGVRNFPDSSATPKYITEARVTKLFVIKRGREGVFLGWHSDPLVGPHDRQLPAQNNSTDYGEQEFQLGIGARVYFDSSGVQCLHPDWGSNARWGALYPTQRHCWGNIDAANYGSYANPDYIALQSAGFPGEQATGPWWFAALHNANATTYPFGLYMVLRDRREQGSFQFSHDAYGQPTYHFAFRGHDAANVPDMTSCFIGAFLYVSANLSAEPTASLRAAVANRANADFELSGQAAVAPETTTVGEVRDRMIDTLAATAPRVLTHRRYVAHREHVEFRTYCEATPAASLRRFTIRDTLETSGPFVNSPYREMHTTLECIVAYPKQGAYHDDVSAGRPALDRQDVIRSDFRVLRQTLGIEGYARLEQDGVNASVVNEEWTVEQTDDAACDYSVLRLRIAYREDPL